MAKNIVFCADGTWNGPGQSDQDDSTATPTNVFKLFQNLDGRDEPDSTKLANEQERSLRDADGTLRQVAKYLHGVGDSGNFLVQVLGGTIGAGLITRIVRGYTFVSRNYVPGDRIFIAGFSRGAYTARALAGLIAAKGLLDATKLDLTEKETAYRLGSSVWYAYRQKAAQANTHWFGRLQQTVLDLPSFLSRPPPDDELIAANIEAVAVWDTVGALGIPEFTLQHGRVDAFQFADLKLSPIVSHGFHAIAVDEQREDFTPTLWNADPRIIQVLFPGAHSDVGGGYVTAQSGLSDAALRWIMDRLGALGVVYAEPLVFLPKPDARGMGHQPWTSVPWTFLPCGPRQFPDGLCISRSLLDRMAGGAVFADPGITAAAYLPGNLGAYLAGTAAGAGITVVG